MDTGTVHKQPNNDSTKQSILGFVLVAVVILFLLASLGGNLSGLMNNDACYTYLGCNAGFFGYDAIVHMVSGVMNIFILIYIMRTWPKFNFLTGSYWKNMLILVAFALVIGLCWEWGEFAADHFKMIVLHMNIINPNRQYQPSNGDTMGDLFFGGIGATITSSFWRGIAKLKPQTTNG
jgi:hypothetical protein